MKALGAALIVVLAAGTARAQPGNTAPLDPDEPPPPAYTTPPPSPGRGQVLPPDRSENTALWLSLGGTLASYGVWIGGVAISTSSTNQGTSSLFASAASIGAVGTLLAPSFGHWYGDKGFTRGFGLRLGALAVGVTAIVVVLWSCPLSFERDPVEDPDCGKGETAGAILGIAALGMWVGGTVDDIVQAPRRVRRRNAARYAITPLVQSDRAGLALVGAF